MHARKKESKRGEMPASRKDAMPHHGRKWGKTCVVQSIAAPFSFPFFPSSLPPRPPRSNSLRVVQPTLPPFASHSSLHIEDDDENVDNSRLFSSRTCPISVSPLASLSLLPSFNPCCPLHQSHRSRSMNFPVNKASVLTCE